MLKQGRLMKEWQDSSEFYKWHVAISQAGHPTVAHASGYRDQMTARIEATDDRHTENEKYWRGHFEMDKSAMTPAIAIAGVVADCYEENPGIDAESIDGYMEDLAVQPETAVAKYVPRSQEKRIAAIEEALAALRKHRRLFNRLIEELHDNLVVRFDHGKQQKVTLSDA